MSTAGGVAPAEGSSPRIAGQPSLRWLWLLVAFQVAVPASYYLRDERSDERFAWRMFSAVRVERCEVRAYTQLGEAERERVDLERALHSGWIAGLERGRGRVIERFLRELCHKSKAEESELKRACEDAIGQRRMERFRMDCATSRLSREASP